MDDFECRGSPLEYWFWKVHYGDLAFLVDFIVRRRTGPAETRVSLWVRGRGRVARALSSSWSAHGSRIEIGPQEFHAGGSQGEVDDVAWHLDWEPGHALVDPRPRAFGPFHPIDMELLVRPQARFNGSVTVAGDTFAFAEAPGIVAHYWGRRLPDRWCWISATEFEHDPDRRLESVVATSRLWGRGRLLVPVGYLWISDGQRAELTLSPITGLIRQRRENDSLVIDTMRVDGRRHRVRAEAPASAFNDLGEGIRQTLIADLECDGRRAVAGRVGLEFRA